MRVESGNRDGRRAVTKEARVRLEVGYGLAVVDVEDFDSVSLCATRMISMLCYPCDRQRHLRSEYRGMFMDTQSSKSIGSCLDSLHTAVPADIP